MPSRRTLSMELTHSLNSLLCFDYCVPIHVPVVTEVLNSAEAMRIPHISPLVWIRCDVRTDYSPEVAAVRVSLLKHSEFQFYDGPELNAICYAIIVLIIPLDSLRRWQRHELGLVEVAADQDLNANMAWMLKKLGEANPVMKIDIRDFCATVCSDQDENETPITPTTQTPGT